jgi:hypothetical protein
MMAWILVSLLASWVGEAVVTLSPEANSDPMQTLEPLPLPPKP